MNERWTPPFLEALNGKLEKLNAALKSGASHIRCLRLWSEFIRRATAFIVALIAIR